MKISEMNAHQKLAYQIMNEVTSEYIGGNENTMSDYAKDSEQYISAKAFLTQPREDLKKEIYMEIMVIASSRKCTKHMNFAGTEFIMERIEKRLQKWGY